MADSSTTVVDKQPPTEELAERHDSCGTDEQESLTQWPAHNNTGADSEMSVTVAKEDDTLVSCEFDCGPPMPGKHMMNKGNARSSC